jgi:hypothetical protein
MLEVINKRPLEKAQVIARSHAVRPHAALARRAYTCSAGCPEVGDKVLSGPYRPQ